MIKDSIKQILAELGERVDTFDDEALVRIADRIDSGKRLFFGGMGRSRLFIMSFCMRLMHMGFTCYMLGDVTTPAITKDDMLIIGSGSGETGSLVAAAGKAKKIGAEIVLFTIAPDSSIGRLADHKFVIEGPSNKLEGKSSVTSMQPMGSLFEQSCLFAYEGVIVYLMHKHHTNGDELFKLHANLE